ncbi:MAG: hypothetical protein FWC19_10100 [Treponema sp.]|nr:hypothetical protein [Treponema sp.]MCL2273139.1 hypothetical protein [Treponema sp.]
MTGCINAPSVYRNPEKVDEFMIDRTSNNFSDRGAIALIDDEYRFTVILVKDLKWALESMKIADYGLPHISRFKRGENISPFLTFGTFNKENVNLTYSIKLQRPGGKFASKEYNDIVIAHSTLYASMTYPAQEFATINFDETTALGLYQFYIIIKDSGSVINSCIIQFELIE